MQQIKQKKWNYPALAFAAPFIGMLMVMLISGYKPFGSYSMLYSDMYHQYYPFFVAFRSALRSGDSLLYSWNVGMGMDYLGLISYYLASPLNLLSVLVPEGWLLEFFSLLMPIKLGLAGLFFALFLKELFRRDDLSLVLFGSFYALCAWALGYQWNIMWLDTFALLPLVALGAIRLLRENRFALYTLTLFLSIFANYYIGFFTCIFVLLLFICYEICCCKSGKQFFLDISRMALFSILAIGMTAVLELPALAALGQTQSSVNQFPEGFRLNIASENTWKGLLDAMRQVAGNMGGGLEPTFKEGLPNLYCGVGTLTLAFLMLTCKKVSLREKLCAVVLLLFFMLSFILRQLDYIWHGFHFTNMIPYRFSFLYSFVLLYMAYRAYLLRNHFRSWQILLSALLVIGCLACSDHRSEPIFLAYNGIFLVFYLFALFFSLRRTAPPTESDPQARREFLLAGIAHRKLASMAFLGIMALELVLNLVNFGVHFPGTNVSNYPKGTTYAASMIRYMKEREEDTPFYRAEVTHSQTLNDGALNNYNGISTFTSSANVRVTEFMQRLGYGAKNTYNRYCFEESSPVANLFLGLKYMLERDGAAAMKENNYFTEIHHYGDVYLLENNAYLPLGFLANSTLTDVDWNSNRDNFTFQNQLFRVATGVTEDVWHFLPENTLSVTADGGAVIGSQPSLGSCSYTCAQEAGTVYYTYTADKEGLLCIDLNLSARNSYSVYKNGALVFSESYSLPQTLSVCQVIPGDQIEIRLDCTADKNGSITILAAVADEEVFRRGYQILSASTLTLTDFSNTYVAGTISCDRDGLLYTSIPQNGNWQAAVDGVNVETILVGDTMIALPLTAGEHTVTLSYHNTAFSLGWKISLACAAVFLWLLLSSRKAARQPGKYQKPE
ncbi:MAG TPA: YfhO family protein [Candidatus Faecousia intestinigallinarum]|nr:YfhO family protein [Candidatus Faecousia intestinigallinarum]